MRPYNKNFTIWRTCTWCGFFPLKINCQCCIVISPTSYFPPEIFLHRSIFSPEKWLRFIVDISPLSSGYVHAIIVQYNSSFPFQLHLRRTISIHFLVNQGSTKIAYFIIPGAGCSCARTWPYKLYSNNALFLYFFKNHFLYCLALN